MEHRRLHSQLRHGLRGHPIRLAASGPAVDGGGAIPWLGTDFAGGLRPTDGDGNGSVQWDLGAFEVGGGGGVIPPAPSAPAAPVLLP